MRQAEEVVGKFLNRPAHQEIIDLASKFLDEGRSPRGISRAWLTDQHVQALREMLDDTEVRDKFTIACYVLIETHDRANAGYRLQQNRRLPRPDVITRPHQRNKLPTTSSPQPSERTSALITALRGRIFRYNLGPVIRAEHYERRSLGIISNLAFSEWERIFANPTATAAAIDRVVHHAVILEFDVPSYQTDAAQ